MTSEKQHISWHDANQAFLIAAINQLKIELLGYQKDPEVLKNYEQLAFEASNNLQAAANQLVDPPALENLCSIFGLTSFERNILLLAAGVELDSEFEAIVASIQNKEGSSSPSISLALSALAEAHWSAITPNAPLRYWNLIHIPHTQSITASVFYLDEQILNYLIGLNHMNKQFYGIINPYLKKHELVPSQQEIAKNISEIIPENDLPVVPAILLAGVEPNDALAVASSISSERNKVLYTISACSFPDNQKEVVEFARLWNRESYLNSACIFVDCNDIDSNDTHKLQKITSFCDEIRGITFVGCSNWMPKLRRKRYTFNVQKPSPDEQYNLWKNELGDLANILDGHLSTIVSQFSLSADAIRQASADVAAKADESGKNTSDLYKNIWHLCCTHSRPNLDDLAQRIEPKANWDDLVLPRHQKNTLYEIASHVKQRVKVYEQWGWGKKNSRGLGISVLFTGESGTGKTMSSEILAKELNLDLYRIDLSQVVNKYIGETEKNLKKIFDAAEAGGAVLLFDEADALFGKRSEVRDSHDRYANIEVSYLLQRMEAYRGLAILTTNLKSSMDKAFLRRLRFIVNFPFPDLEHRAEIWSKIFPESTPLNNIDINRLAKLNIAGGNILNIALNAAFIAAERDSAVTTEDIEKAARFEYAKLEKPMSVFEKIHR